MSELALIGLGFLIGIAVAEWAQKPQLRKLKLLEEWKRERLVRDMRHVWDRQR